MKVSAISWTDFSGGNLNFVTGCTPVSVGCQNCYAKAIYDRFDRDFTPTAHLLKLGRLWDKRFPEHSPKRGAPHKPMAFVCDTGDLFHEGISDDIVVAAYQTMVFRSDVIWQVLTKRPARMREIVVADGRTPPNIWLGVTAENQKTADERIPLLLSTPAAVRFVSVEPMLEAIDLTEYMESCRLYCGGDEMNRCGHELPCKDFVSSSLHWVICGAESGRKRRPFSVEWAEDLAYQCGESGVPFFGKQDSGLRPGVPLLIDGREIKEWPA